MKRLAVLFLGVIMICGLATASLASADASNFTFKDFTGDYYLSRDDEGRSVLRVVETFTAQFPDTDQSKGVMRLVPGAYEGHPTSFHFESLTRNGQKEPVYSQERRGSDIVISTGTDDYVRGEQTYVLTYTLRDIIKDSGDYQEFYWDTVGTGSAQPFGSVVGRVHLDDSVQSLFQGDTLCYQGAYGSTRTCEVEKDGSTVTFSSSGRVGPRQNVSMIMRFEADAFVPYQQSWWAGVIEMVLPFVAGGLSAGGLVAGLIARRRHGKDAPGRGTIVPEYLPPRDISVLQASGIISVKGKPLPAQLIDLAVRHKIQIIETSKKTLLGKKSAYSFKLLAIEGLREDEQRVVDALFTAGAKEGAMYELDAKDYKIGAQLRHAHQMSSSLSLIKDEYRRKVRVPRWPIALSVVALLLALVTFIWNLVLHDEPSLSSLIVLMVAFPAAVSVVILMTTMRPLTDKGAAMREYLEGLKMYIRLAETERLKVLQSPQGAEKTPIDTADTAQLVRLYERVLPYAVLFNLETEWSKVLEIAYADTEANPDWYSGSRAFQAGMLGSVLSDFSSTTAAQLAPPSSDGGSSSSGFSSGGGFSGGGGGGGSFGGR